MDAFLDYVEKYKFAILGTVLVHIIFFFYSTFATLERPYTSVDPEAEVLIPLDEVEFDPEIMEMMKLNEQKPQEVTNIIADANDQREKSHHDFSSQEEMDEEVMKSAEELEKEYQDYWKGQRGPDESSNADIEDPDKEEKDSRKNNVNKNNIDTEGSNAVAGEVLVRYDLSNRKAHDLPKPGYTCNSSGTVVVDIKVDKTGAVKSASFNAGLSSGADECMIDKAIRYAKKSRFNYSGGAPSAQSGTITYKFVSRK